MRKNYLFATIGVLFCFASYAQSPNKTYKDSTRSLSKAAGAALNEYDYNSAIETSLKLIDLASGKNDVESLNHGYNILGITYEVLEDSVRAKENYQKALEYAEATQNDTLIWYAYNNLGNIYSANEKTVDKGLTFYQKAIEIANKLEQKAEVLTPIINIGWTHLENRDYDKAFPYLVEAEEILETEKDTVSLANLQILFGMYFAGKEEYRKAQDYFEEAIALVEKDSLLPEASFAFEEYAKMLFKSGNFEQAYVALEKHQKLKQELFQEEKNLQREAVYGRFETEEYKKDLVAVQREKQYKEKLLAKTRQISMIMVISIAVMFIFLILLFRNNRIRQGLIAELRDKNDKFLAAKEEAEKLSQLKTRFFSTVSHELRTPLYGVVGLTSLLLEDSKNEKQKEDLKSLKFSADYLLALINDVLQMNKMESNLVQLENGAFNIEELFKGILKSFETSGNFNKNKIELEIDERIPRSLIGDSMRLSQIMMNLVGNAVKFTDNGTVWVKAIRKDCDRESCLIYFEVGDTGIGIPQNKQQKIFEEFSQLHSQNINYQGTGLGLPIVKKLLHLFGSEIHLDSEEGKGSVFSFTLELEKGVDIEPLVINSEAVSIEELQELHRKVLIVDDNKINQVVTRRILEKKDFLCMVAGSGEEALKILKNDHVDLVLMDVNMPGMNGMETTVEIRKFNMGIPIIALTAVEVGERRDEIIASGMNDIINKPYNLPQFFGTIYRNLLQPVA